MLIYSMVSLLLFFVRGKETLEKGKSFKLGEEKIRGGPKVPTETPVSLLLESLPRLSPTAKTTPSQGRPMGGLCPICSHLHELPHLPNRWHENVTLRTSGRLSLNHRSGRLGQVLADCPGSLAWGEAAAACSSRATWSLLPGYMSSLQATNLRKSSDAVLGEMDCVQKRKKQWL